MTQSSARSPQSYVKVACELAIEAGRKIMQLSQTALVKERKADHSLVTNADHAADAIIRTGLHRHFPTHSILTEESGVQGPLDAEFLWVVDPLDGTRAFARGIAGFSVMIGLLREGQPFAGVVMDPWEGYLYEAIKGEGTHVTFKGKRERHSVSKRKNWATMPIITSTGFPPPIEKQIQAKLPCPWIPAINSVGIKVGVLVRQEADLYLNHHSVHYWDTVAPQIILEEAGGVFTFTNGKPLTYDLSSNLQHGGPTVATNGQRHSEFVRIIQPLL